MDTNNQEFYEDEEVQEIPVRKKKKKKGRSPIWVATFIFIFEF